METAFRPPPSLPTGPSSNGTDPDMTSEGRDNLPSWLQVTTSEGGNEEAMDKKASSFLYSSFNTWYLHTAYWAKT